MAVITTPWSIGEEASVCALPTGRSPSASQHEYKLMFDKFNEMGLCRLVMRMFSTPPALCPALSLCLMDLVYEWSSLYHLFPIFKAVMGTVTGHWHITINKGSFSWVGDKKRNGNSNSETENKGVINWSLGCSSLKPALFKPAEKLGVKKDDCSHVPRNCHGGKPK